jgi:hypothetical protein
LRTSSRLLGLGLIAGLSLSVFKAQAADQRDIYFEAFAGLDVDKTHRVLLGTTVGYCPWDEIGIGVTFEQALGSKSTDSFDSSLRGAVEFRWFLEPWEFWLDTGYLVSSYKTTTNSSKSGTINLGGAYLFAITPSIALRTGVHIQFPYTATGTLFTTAALRVLW